MPKKLFLLLIFLLSCSVLIAAENKKPKLVVIIVVDQLPYEYLSKYGEYFSAGGFNLLMKSGANFTNCRYPYAYTKTACGHATISTGAYPDINGIVGNSWYDRAKGSNMNCVGDDSVQYVGAKAKGGRSPKNLLTFALADMVRLSTNFRSKAIGISTKDRSAILTAGKFGTAYWIADSVFVSTTYYMKSLPAWVNEYNASGAFQKYFGATWNLLKPEITATVCDDDSNTYEYSGSGLGTTFPHHIVGESNTGRTASYFDALDTSPFAVEVLTGFAKKAFIAESLGQRGITDMLSLCISTTDIIGHGYGPQSREVFDNLLRTDKYLADFFSFLDKKIGLKNCVLALTGDHGIAPTPEYVKKKSPTADAGRISSDQVKKYCGQVLRSVYGGADSIWIKKVVEFNIYLNEDALRQNKVTMSDALQTLKDSLTANFPVFAAYSKEDLMRNSLPEKLVEQLRASYYPKRSGDLMFILKPFWNLDAETTGTNHGSPWEYDTHVPLLLYGAGIKPGIFADEVSPADIAPTLALLLGIEFPVGREGRVLKEAVR